MRRSEDFDADRISRDQLLLELAAPISSLGYGKGSGDGEAVCL